MPSDFDINDIDYDPLGNPIGTARDDLITSLQTQFGTAEQTRSPLILDLDGLNGVETLSKTAGIHFDHDGNKFAEQSGWVGKNDGMLVWDRNGNNQIDNGAELFGNNTVLKNGSKADNGFTALADLDSNKDGKVDANDAAASQLRVFKDANSNGVVDAGELLTLAQAGVKSLNTGYTNQTVTDANGNQHLQAGSFTTTAGQTRAMDDVWFAVDTARTVGKDLVTVNSTIAALPDIAGFGNVHSLHQAMARDASGKLQALVQRYAGAGDAAVRASLLNDIIYRWAGVQDIDPASRAATQIYGNAIGDARKLATLETFLGEGYLGTWCWGERDPNPHSQAATVLLKAYDQLVQWVDGQLMTQTVFRPLYESIGLRLNPDSQGLEWDVSALVATLKTQYSVDPIQGQALLAGFIDNLKIVDEAGLQISAELERQSHIQGQEFLALMGYADRSRVAGTIGEDTLYAKTNLDSFMISGSGNDTLYGGAGADILLGNAGADKLDGGAGTDIYIWSKGEGNDTINDLGMAGDVDTLKLLDVKASEAMLSRDMTNLYVTIGAEKITIKDHFAAGYLSAPIEQILLADGGRWQKADLDAALYRGGTGNETIYGTFSAEGFLGGKGADTLYGGAGGDTYSWFKGDGNDTINDLGAATDIDTLKLADVKMTDALLSRDSVNLYVTIGAEKITIKNHFSTIYYEAAPIEQILFSDGGKWLKADLDAAPYRGGDGADTIYGTTAAEAFIGGKGADTFWGGTGSDCYSWSRGDGNDTINDVGLAADADTLKLLDVKAAEVQLSRDSVNLYVTIGAEKITIKNHFSTIYYEAAPIEQILFSDGGKWLKADLDAAPYRGGAGTDTIYGTTAAETFIGGKGADTLWGGAGSDSYFWSKGEGNDTINDLGLAADVDTLKLLDVKTNEAQLSRDTVNLYLTIGAEKITIKNHFSTIYYEAAPIEQILFSDGGKWLKGDLDAAAYRGGDGADTIYGTTAAETFIGGKGADTLWGGAGSDSYFWSKGEGNDTINDLGLAADVDTLKLLDVKTNEAQLSRDSANLYVTIGAEKITIKNHFSTIYYEAAPIEQILFADGGKWQKAELDLAPYRGTAGKDTIYGTAQAETFIGGAEADTLMGGAGSDVYKMARGDGADVISEYDTTAGNTDVLQFMAGISANQLWFRKAANDLEVSVIGTADKATVQNWYLGNQYHVEQIKSGDGKVLQDTQVDRLVQAMAAFAPPAMGQASLTAAQQTALAPVLAANWR